MDWKSVVVWFDRWEVAIGVISSLAGIGGLIWGMIFWRFRRAFRRLRAGNRSLLAANEKLQKRVLDLELANGTLKGELAKLQPEEPGHGFLPVPQPDRTSGHITGF